MKFYKPFLFLFFLNSLFIFPVWLTLGLRFIIPSIVFLSILDLFLLFSSKFHIKNQLVLSSFPPDDSYGIYSSFEKLKTQYNLKNIQLFKVKNIDSAFFFFSGYSESYIVLSENILENFSKADIQKLLNYPFQMIHSGDLFFLTLLSRFLFLGEKLFLLLGRPFSIFKKKSQNRETLALILTLNSLSLLTKGIFYNRDKNLFTNKNKKKSQALLLWQLNSLVKLSPPKVLAYLAPLFLTNPLTDSSWESDNFLHPPIRKRIISLIGSYPP